MKHIVAKLEGLQTIKTIMNKLRTNKKKAIYIVHKLRKEGYVKTRKLSNQTRIYHISSQNRLGGKDYYEIINENSPLKVAAPNVHKIYGREPTLEEAVIFAIKSKSLRMILAALALFKHIHNWTELFRLARKNNAEKKVIVLYELAHKVMRVRKMPRRYMKEPASNTDYEYIIKDLRSKDYQDLEKKWKVFLPFNKADLEGVYI